MRYRHRASLAELVTESLGTVLWTNLGTIVTHVRRHREVTLRDVQLELDARVRMGTVEHRTFGGMTSEYRLILRRTV